MKLGAITSKTASARFDLVFDGSPRPERADFVEGDESLQAAGEQMREKDFPVRFPDASSIKIVRRGQVSCGSSGCAVELLPINYCDQGELKTRQGCELHAEMTLSKETVCRSQPNVRPPLDASTPASIVY